MSRAGWVERTSSTVVMSPVVVVLGVLMGATNLQWAEPYWLDLSSKATGSLLLLAPALASLSAWDAARWRVLAVDAVRSWPELLGRHLLLVVAITAVTFGVSLGLLFAQAPPPVGGPRLDVLVGGVWMVVAYAAVGFLLGRVAPRLPAAVGAFAVVWFWVAYTPAVQPFWLRNVTGNLAASCCTVDSQLADRSLAAPTLVGAGLLVAAVTVVYRPSSRIGWAGSAAAVTATVALAATWMADVGPDPTVRRTTARACVTTDGTTLCAWPEHRDRLERAAAPLAEAAGRLRAVGLQVPARLEESLPSDRRRWTFSLSGGTPENWVGSFATSPLDYVPACRYEVGLWPGAAAEPLTTAWLEATAGLDPVDVAAADPEVDPAELQRILAEPRAQQKQWYEAQLVELDRCADPA